MREDAFYAKCGLSAECDGDGDGGDDDGEGSLINPSAMDKGGDDEGEGSLVQSFP